MQRRCREITFEEFISSAKDEKRDKVIVLWPRKKLAFVLHVCDKVEGESFETFDPKKEISQRDPERFRVSVWCVLTHRLLYKSRRYISTSLLSFF